MRILLADDDAAVRDPLEIALRRQGYEVLAAADGEQAWKLFTDERPDFAVLDVTMPRLDGIALARRIVESGGQRVPIIMLTGRDGVHEKVDALDLGADDYIVKPCSDRELTARIRAVWRRTRPPSSLLVAGELAIDPSTHDFFVDTRRVELTANEFQLLLALMERAGHVGRHGVLMRRIWGSQVSNDLLRMTIYRLRHKIEPDPSRPRYIQTVAGVGFVVLAAAKAEA